MTRRKKVLTMRSSLILVTWRPFRTMRGYLLRSLAETLRKSRPQWTTSKILSLLRKMVPVRAWSGRLTTWSRICQIFRPPLKTVRREWRKLIDRWLSRWLTLQKQSLISYHQKQGNPVQKPGKLMRMVFPVQARTMNKPVQMSPMPPKRVLNPLTRKEPETVRRNSSVRVWHKMNSMPITQVQQYLRCSTKDWEVLTRNPQVAEASTTSIVALIPLILLLLRKHEQI